jgi:hypothetical protein
LNDQQYRALCDECDRVLLGPDAGLERTSIAWLHVLNEHPANAVKYADLFDGPAVPASRARAALISLAQWGRECLDRRDSYSSQPIAPGLDVLIVSHLLNPAHAGTEDFYFGGLPEQLAAAGLKVAVLLRDHTGLDPRRLAQKWQAGMAPRILLSRTLGAIGELGLRQRLSTEARHLRREASDSEGLRRRVLVRASQEALGYPTIATLRYHDQMLRILPALRPKAVVATYEGHAWERLTFSAARSILPGTRCLGYHHAILFPRQHAIKRTLGSAYDPDIVVTAGDVTRDVLAETPGTVAITVGTSRQDTPAAAPAAREVAGEPASCLVIPDGTMEECLTILDFTLAAAAAAPEIRFIVRMHPVQPFEAVAARDTRLTNLPANVIRSDKTIEQDFGRCRWALYRGSGAAIRATAAGLRPFYVVRSGELSIDPLYRLASWRRVVVAAAEFAGQVRQDMQAAPQVLQQEWEPAREFCRRYFLPLQPDRFRAAIVDTETRSANAMAHG